MQGGLEGLGVGALGADPHKPSGPGVSQDGLPPRPSPAIWSEQTSGGLLAEDRRSEREQITSATPRGSKHALSFPKSGCSVFRLTPMKLVFGIINPFSSAAVVRSPLALTQI